jgi:hypothetical protein
MNDRSRQWRRYSPRLTRLRTPSLSSPASTLMRLATFQTPVPHRIRPHSHRLNHFLSIHPIIEPYHIVLISSFLVAITDCRQPYLSRETSGEGCLARPELHRSSKLDVDPNACSSNKRCDLEVQHLAFPASTSHIRISS